MDFYNYEDARAYAGKYAKRHTGDKRRQLKNMLRGMAPDDFFDAQIESFYKACRRRGMSEEESGGQVFTVAAQQVWYRWGKPYYKIWPQMLDALSVVDINIPGRFLQLPYPFFEIKLPTCHTMGDPDHPRLVGILVSTAEKGDDLSTGIPIIGQGNGRKLVVSYQFDEPVHERDRVSENTEFQRLEYSYAMTIEDDTTLQDRLAQADQHTSIYNDGTFEPATEFRSSLMRLAIATCFFGVGQHEVVMPDIPHKFITKYREAISGGNPTEEILSKGHRKTGAVGWKVGSEIDLPLPMVRYEGKDGEPMRKRELETSHIRRGHMRMQQVGPRDDPRYKMVFIPPTVVRPDLPLGRSAGYRIHDDNLTRI
jgi:hypothetical protein